MPHQEKRTGRTSKRDQLLDAAAAIVSKHGVQQLTIDAVAAAAKVTKAGLIYHFKTRDELLGALVERMVQDFDVQALPQEGLTTRSVLDQMSRDTFEMPPEQRQLMTNLLAAVSSHPQLIAPVQALYSRNFDWITQSGEHASQAMLLVAALDGIALLELLNLHQFTPQQRASMRAALESAIRVLP